MKKKKEEAKKKATDPNNPKTTIYLHLFYFAVL